MKIKTKTLRASSYLNHIDIGDGTSIIFNGSTLCIDLLPTEYINEILNLGDTCNFSLSEEEKQHLINRGHLTTLTVKQEIDAFKKQARFILEKCSTLDKERQIGNLTFLLTYSCNLSCSYCFQKSLPDKSKNSTMSAEFVDNFFAKYFPKLFPKTQKIIITLFGGEPLLPNNREAINRILAHAKENPLVRIFVATNATTLDEMLDLMGPEQGKIQGVQVTLDGDSLLHDQNRIPVSGKPTFDTMVAAIKKLIHLKVNVSIRMHLHQGQMESAQKLVEYLEKEEILNHPLVSVYFSPINTFSSEQISANDISLFRQIFQNVAAKTCHPPSNLNFMVKFLEMQSEKILPKVRYCGAGSDTFYIADPLGDIYDCFEEAGHKDRRIGTFSNGEVKFFPLKEKYAKRHLLNIPECIKCSYALFCGGGCPSQARVQSGSIYKAYCHQNKEFISQTLKAFYLKKISSC
ncbi:MAG: radical SAM protein [Oligoflexia bacterium]|nr:radical SAM protein [Oligoflexia bacterium]